MLLLYLGHGDPIQFFFLQSHQLTSVTESYISAKHLVQELTISQRISHIMPSTNFPAGSVEEAVQEAQSALADYLVSDAMTGPWTSISRSRRPKPNLPNGRQSGISPPPPKRRLTGWEGGEEEEEEEEGVRFFFFFITFPLVFSKPFVIDKC
ncbi:unnamed protein product [Fusarium graminearum]|nr:unnamed protein product [Fusarium graminearum]